MAERKKVPKVNLRQNKTKTAVGSSSGARPAAAVLDRSSAQQKEKTTAPHINNRRTNAKSAAAAPEKRKTRKSEPEQIVMFSKPKQDADRTARTNSETATRSKAPARPAQTKTPQHSTAPARRKTNPSTAGARRIAPRFSASKSFHVLEGRKLLRFRKQLITYGLAAIVVLAILLFSLLTPTGPIEKITNSFALAGSGTMPSALVGTRVSSLKTKDNKAFVLSNSHLCGYTASGKQFIEQQHDFSNPVLSVSAERVLVYNRESTDFLVMNNSGVLHHSKLDNAIFCGDISDSGRLIFATKATGYAAQVLVLSKSLKTLYTWYAVEGLVSDVAISNDGTRFAVATLTVANGQYKTMIRGFHIGTKAPLYELEVAGQPVVDLSSYSDSYFSYATENSLNFVRWKTGAKTTDTESSRFLSFFKRAGSGAIAVFGEDASSVFHIYNARGIKQSQFEYNGLIDDVAATATKLYVLKNNTLTVLDHKGQVLTTTELKQNPTTINAGKSGVFAADNLQISYYAPHADKKTKGEG